jgi:hypothetical protein
MCSSIAFPNVPPTRASPLLTAEARQEEGRAGERNPCPCARALLKEPVKATF